MLDIRYQDETPWRFELGDFLEDRGLTADDVTDIIMLVKDQPTDDDADAVIQKTMLAGEIALVDGNVAIVQIQSSDYGTRLGTFLIYLGIKATGYSSVWLEAKLKDNRIQVVRDGIRA